VGRKNRKRFGLVASIGALALVALAGLSANATAGRRPDSPNIVFVLTDDLDTASLDAMPRTRRLIAAQGVTFDHYFVNVAVCCPSRMTTLRGQYSHNTGVLTNGGGNGGFGTARALGVETDTIATRLRTAGYHTALLGKYLNGYPGAAGQLDVPPGWTTWVSAVQGTPYSQYDYTLNENGTLRAHGRQARDYGTDVYVRKAQRVILHSARAGTPFFIYLSVYAPHRPATPARRDLGLFPDAEAPRTPAFNQADVGRMPSFVRSSPLLSTDDIAKIDALYRDRLRSLQAVDRGIASLVRTLRQSGELRDTFIVFTSDNGYHLGQHRLPGGKLTAYDTDVRVPLLIHGPGVAAGATVRNLAGNVDLAPTFAAMARIHPPDLTDGRNLLSLARAPRRPRPSWRQAYLLQAWAETPPPPGRPVPPAPGPTTLHEATPLTADLDRVGPTPYSALRTSRHLYVEYTNGERELYDVLADPDQIHNLASRGQPAEQALGQLLAAQRTCRADQCRILDARNAP
jgi:N-acetylglucosamine-6-sulfatase